MRDAKRWAGATSSPFACTLAAIVLAASCAGQPEEPEQRPTLPWPTRSSSEETEPEDAIDYYPELSELDIPWAEIHQQATPMAPQCARSEPHVGPGAHLMEQEWQTPLLGWAVNPGSLGAFPDSLLSVTVGRLWKLDRHTGEVLYVTRQYNWTGGQVDMNKGMDGLAYLSCPDILTIDPVDLRPLYYDRSTGLSSHCKDPLILPDGRIAMHSVFGDLRMYRPVPPSEGETVGRYVVDWRLAHGGDGWLVPLLYDEERDLIISGSGLIREGDTTRWETFAIRAADGTRVWTVHRSMRPRLLLGDASFIGDSAERTDDGRVVTLEKRSRLTTELEASSSWIAPQGTNPWEMMRHEVVASSDGSRVYVIRLMGLRRENDKLSYSIVMAFDRDLNHLWSFETGEPDWPEPPELSRSGFVRADINQATVLPDHSLVAATRSCDIYRLGPDGEMLWSDVLPYPMGAVPPLVDGDRLLVLTEHDPRPLGKTRFSALRSYRFLPVVGSPLPGKEEMRERMRDAVPFEPSGPGGEDP